MEQKLEDFLTQQFDALPIEGGMRPIRLKGWEHYQGLGLPGRHTEAYRYLSRRDLLSRELVKSEATELSKEDLTSYILPECTQSVLVFVNGHYSVALSETSGIPEQVVVGPMDEAVRTYGAFLKNRWLRTLKDEIDPFVAVNVALAENGLFIYVPPKTIVETPIQILNVTDCGDAAMMVVPRMLAFVGAQAEITCCSTSYHRSGAAYAVNMVHDWTLDDAARVEYSAVTFDEPSDVWRLEAIRAQLKRDSFFRAVTVTAGSKAHRQDVRVGLNGENGDARMKGLWMLSDSRQAHTNVQVDHRAPNCQSMQLYKGVLNDSSKSSFEGKIFVDQIAQQTDAFQLNKNLLLGEHAHAYSKPNLEIFADDVKASHGSTVGQLDQEEMFYLQTRGVPRREAQGILLRGFALDVLENLPVTSLRQRAAEVIEKQL